MYSLISTDIFIPQIQNNLIEFGKDYNFVDISFCSLGKDFSSKPQGIGGNSREPKHMFKRFIIYLSWKIKIITWNEFPFSANYILLH